LAVEAVVEVQPLPMALEVVVALEEQANFL
jgi:hypothetical protein